MKTFEKLINDLCSNLRNNIRDVHNSKFRVLGIQRTIEVNSTNITSRKTMTMSIADPITNLSDYQLSDIERSLLLKGLKYGIYEKKVDEAEIFTRFEQLAQSLKLEVPVEQKDKRFTSLNPKQKFFSDLTGMAFEFVNLSKRAIDNLSVDERQALNNLSKNKSIVITKADKGNAVVIQNIVDYQQKVSEILKDSNKFKLLVEDPTVAREIDLSKTLAKIIKNNKLDSKLTKKLFQSGCKAGVMYGLAV